MRRLGDYSVNNNFHPLREIEGQEVIVTSTEQEPITQNGVRKWKTYITIESGETYIAWSPSIAAVFRKLKESDYPIKATFILKQDGTRSFWTYQ